MAENSKIETDVGTDVSLIVPADAELFVGRKDEAKLHSGSIGRIFGYKKVEKTPESMRADLEKLSETVSTIAESLQAKQAGAFGVKTIEIGLAITAEGSIGIATAGVEASVSITLERK
jgi:hypothetical protein